MWLLLMGITAVMPLAYIYEINKDPVGDIYKVHMAIRESFEFKGRKLTPLKISHDLEQFAYDWVDTCEMFPPMDPIYYEFGASVIKTTFNKSIAKEWETIITNERNAYNPTTGECTTCTCENYKQLIQPNNKYFGCSAAYCPVRKPGQIVSYMTVCLYETGQQSNPIQQPDISGPVTTSSTSEMWPTTTTTTRRPTTTATATEGLSSPTVTTSTMTTSSLESPPVYTDTAKKEGEDKGEAYAYGDTSIETMKAGLIEVHMSIRNNFEFRGEKLTPFTYSKELEDLALEWAKTCHKSEPKDPRFANLGNNVGSCPIHWPLLREWSDRLLAQAKAYNPATGECLGSPCEHYRELVQPNNTKFGCAINVCHFTKPKPKSMLLSVCLYKAEQQSDPIQQGAHSVTTTGGSTSTGMTTATSTTSESDTTGSVELSVSSEVPFVPISTEMKEIEADDFVKEDDEEAKKEESFKSDYEGDEEGKEEQSYRSVFACDTTKVFPHLLSFAVVTIALFS
ncbi:unnamed protein product [Taenia asiatica]|uniref:SCP domain-containing protein n=1 Tax=Taenia asiatica TaxID=60517 RepID=A0A158R8F3_TAEAS|nr:unnamed protein product [Taenia asiatica]